jgi:hypothetical protein
MIAIILLVRFPKVVRKEDEIVGAWETHLAYILSLSFWAKPIVQNATIRKKVTN